MVDSGIAQRSTISIVTTHIIGIDFTSAPSWGKPITVAESQLEGDVLSIRRLRRLASFEEFDGLLVERGPWVAGIDFPFGQPRRLITALNWPLGGWADYVSHVAMMEKTEFESVVKRYKSRRLKGDKDHRRATDVLAKSTSPMNVVNPPVGKMFFRGAPRILRSGSSIVPCAPSESDRVVVEAYPALVVQALEDDRVKYKDGKGLGLEHVRGRIADRLTSARCRTWYGVTVRFDSRCREQAITDESGDLLDAVLCAVQAAWAAREPGFGIPESCDPLEGWITDPALAP